MRRIFLANVLAVSFLCAGCGIDTTGWPTIKLEFDSNNITSIAVTYKQNATSYFEEIDDYFVIEDLNKIETIVNNFTNKKYKEKIEKKFNYDNYLRKAVLDFNVMEEGQTSIYQYSLYELDVEDCRIIFPNQEIHFA